MMKKLRATKHLRNEKGMASIETIPLILVFVYMLCYEFGMFGVIHTGIMQSISARAYAFETFKNRSNLVYFRDTPTPQIKEFRTNGARTHNIASEDRGDSQQNTDGVAAERPLRVGIPMDPDNASRRDVIRHSEKLFELNLVGPQKRNQKVEVSPVWVQVQYGMCIDAKCGG